MDKAIATALGAGYSPFAPGTAGALVGLLAVWGADVALRWTNPSLGLGPEILLILIFVTTGLGVWTSNRLEVEWGKDPSRVVIDEVVGMWISLLWVPLEWKYLLIAFFLFRLFDIWKPWHVAKAEQLPGGWGIMMDDVVAGVYSCLVLHLLLYFGV
ncbi:MAG: phosphatidylglycerophosphatase A [Bacteroidota bacterium]